MPALSFAATGLAFLFLHERLEETFSAVLVLACYGLQQILVVIPGMVAQAKQAVEDGCLPLKFGGEPRWKHVSGVITSIFLVIVVAIIWAARLAESNYDNLVITGDFGLAMIVGVGGLFTIYIFLPRLLSTRASAFWSRASSRLLGPGSVPSGWFVFVSRLFSVLDSWLVYLVAPLAGVTQARTRHRYGVMLTYMLTCGVLGWYVPAPFGLAPIAFAFALAIAISRRWSWVEDDRALTLRNPGYSQDQLRVGVEQDLRDEALLALLSLLVFVPLAMRQVHFAMPQHPIFVFSELARDDLRTWLQFFGVELTKAVPFVDWADIYKVRTDAAISVASPIASHVVFGARAIVDLVFLAALLQAISISVRLSGHKRMFFEKDIALLDPIVERAEFEKLAVLKKSEWVFLEDIEQFTHYDAIALSRLRVDNPKGSSIYAVATEIMRRKGIVTDSPGERFLKSVSMKEPRVADVTLALHAAFAANDVPLEYLIAAHRSLNRRPPFNQVRQTIIERMASLPPSPERTTALRHTFSGPDADSLGSLRRTLIDPMQEAAVSDPRALKALQVAAEHDRSATVRSLAEAAVKTLAKAQPQQATEPLPEPAK
ncbi:MAG: hypothetical protein Q8R02_03320 [Hyphomonadaceae bacterium]|nr:hypothetical protein [Hyphomonadaceae bacterium]